MTRFAVCITALLLTSTSVLTEDMAFDGFQVYEFDASRFAPNDTKPTLYDIKLVGKDDALWIEGNDYNYLWLTIVPYASVESVKLDRRHGDPFVEAKGGWLGKQLAKAGDARSWYTIKYRDKKDEMREVILLAPILGGSELADYLADRAEGEIARPPKQVEEADGQLEAELSAPSPRPESTRTTPPEPIKLIDVMTVSEFRAAGLGKLTDSELDALDAWINLRLRQK